MPKVFFFWIGLKDYGSKMQLTKYIFLLLMLILLQRYMVGRNVVLKKLIACIRMVIDAALAF